MKRYLITDRLTVEAVRHHDEWWYPLSSVFEALGLGAVSCNAYPEHTSLPFSGKFRNAIPEPRVRSLIATPSRIRYAAQLRNGAVFSDTLPESAPSAPPIPEAPPPSATPIPEASIRALVDNRITALLAEFAPRRREITASVRAQHVAVVAHHHGLCPCCLRERVVQDGRVSGGEFDHFYSSSQPDEAHTWLVCAPCHRSLTDGRLDRDEIGPVYQAYQYRRRRFTGEQLRLEAAQ